MSKAKQRSQNMVQLFSGIDFTIALKAIGIVILKRKIQSIQKIIQYSHNSRHGREIIRDDTQILIHQYLSAKIQPSAFHKATHITKINDNKNHSFQEKLTRKPIKERIIIEINNNDIISTKGNFQFLSLWDNEYFFINSQGWISREENRIIRILIARRISDSLQV